MLVAAGMAEVLSDSPEGSSGSGRGLSKGYRLMMSSLLGEVPGQGWDVARTD